MPNDPIQFTSVKQLKRVPRNFAAATAEQHEFSPAHLAGVTMVDQDEIDLSDVNVKMEARRKHAPSNVKFVVKKKVDVGAFADAVAEYLSASATGHVMQINQHGTPIYYREGKWAQTKSDLGKPWSADTRMHVASVSKLLTAMGMMKVLKDHGWTHDTHISPFLPHYWHQGAHISQITFANLFQHRSGFHVSKDKTGFQTMKAEVDAGVNNVGDSSGYENVNYGLMRILMPIINGDVDSHMTIGGGTVNDAAWDGLTIGFYHDYMEDHVFKPAGVTRAGFVPLPAAVDGALAYPFPELNARGWNSGDTSTVSGGAGWRLTIKELMKVLHHFRRKNTIVDASTAQFMLEHNFGIDSHLDTDVGTLYWKKGGWHHGRAKEQCVAFFLPDEMELAIFVNSTLGAEDHSLRKKVTDEFEAAIS